MNYRKREHDNQNFLTVIHVQKNLIGRETKKKHNKYSAVTDSTVINIFLLYNTCAKNLIGGETKNTINILQ